MTDTDKLKTGEAKEDSKPKAASPKLGDPARSGNPARRRAVIDKAQPAAESKRNSKRVIPEADKDSPSWVDGIPLSPKWWSPVFVTLLVLGLLWLVVYYFSSGGYPIPGIGAWNLGIGIILMLIGFLMTLRWR